MLDLTPTSQAHSNLTGSPSTSRVHSQPHRLTTNLTGSPPTSRAHPKPHGLTPNFTGSPPTSRAHPQLHGLTPDLTGSPPNSRAHPQPHGRACVGSGVRMWRRFQGGGCAAVWPLQNLVPQFLTMLNIHAMYELSVPLRDVYPREEKAPIRTRLGHQCS